MHASRVRSLARFSRVRDSALPPAEPPDSDLVTVGRVGRPHGLDGSFVVERASEDPARFEPGATVLVAGAPATVVERKRSGGRLVVRLDRRVERGVALQVRREDLPEPEPGTYYAFQLVGLAIEEEGGRMLGTVQEVAPGVANDVLQLDSGLALPMVEACVREVDLKRRRILVARGFTPRN
jgi:16S rRNA processing protein RimM